jgi:two-component system, LuxR family, response regulator FixJ
VSYKYLMTNKLIVVADSNFLLRRYLDRVLAAAGYATKSFATADEFLLEAATCEAACAVLDIELKDSTGLPLACHPTVLTLKCPIVFTSGTVNENLERKALELGGTALVRRPFEAVDILSAIARAIPPR